MAYSAGDRIGPYSLISPLGEGGMGEVWKARDARLERMVAVKFSKEQFSERFEREARAVAALNHPNICQVYDVGPDYLVLEFIDGPTLGERMNAGPMAWEDVVGIARQMAEGMEAAHEKGVVHRDLKPANVKITLEGVVKILDFGLAAVRVAGPAASFDPANSPTLVAATIPGLIMGTASYMSPEQASGKPVDKRSDIWAFGVVLWEMLTGRRLFDGETVSHTLADVLKGEIAFGSLPAGTPRALVELVQRCLERDVKLRLRDIGEARVLLSRPFTTTAPVVVEGASRSSRGAWMTAGAAMLLGLSLAAWGWWQARQRASEAMSRFDVEMGEDLALLGVDAPHIIVSPDGRRVVWQVNGQDGKRRLAVRALEETKPTVLAGTEGGTHQFFSPDGEWVGYHDGQHLRKISIHGGTPVNLCLVPQLRGASWGEDGTIVFAPEQASGLMRVSANGGTPQPLTKLDEKRQERTHRYPFVLPGGKATLFFSGLGGMYESAAIEAVSLETGQRKVVLQGGYFPRYSASGHLLFMRQGTVFAVRMDAKKLELQGTPVAVLEGVRYHVNRGSVEFDVSRSGTLVYVEGKATSTNFSLVSRDASGGSTVFLKPLQEYIGVRFSPDRKRLAFETLESGKRDIWVYDPEREVSTRLTFAPGEHRYPAWTADGTRIAYRRNDGIYWIQSSGGGQPERLTEAKGTQTPLSFSPDGKVLAFAEQRPDGGADIRLLEIDRKDPAHSVAGKMTAFVATAFDEQEGMFSPDGKWFAYTSNESGTHELYVRSYPEGGGRWQISNGGGVAPRWSPNGKELMYSAPDQKLMAVSYSAVAGSFVASKARVWAEKFAVLWGNYDVAADGKRVVGMGPRAGDSMEKPPTRAMFVLNFFEELKRRIP